MFSLLYKWLISLFTVDKIGVIIRKLLISAAKPVAKDIFNIEYQKKAYEFVKELAKRDDLSGTEKAKLFNEKFIRFLGISAKEISISVINCLREMALISFKSENQDI